MREIKFRAWDLLSKSMRRVSVIEFDPGDEVCNVAMPAEPLNSQRAYSDRFEERAGGEYLDLMQFTGLKDKNGKEIYEGDIVSGHNGDGSSNVWPVEYACENSEWTGFNVGADDERDCEVIGNIYENPEPLK
jgi:uncharacterized phage protein (TIGR01671 family)